MTKVFICKPCEKMNKSYRGTRIMVRKHLREEHNIQSSKTLNESRKKYVSPVTIEMRSEEI